MSTTITIEDIWTIIRSSDPEVLDLARKTAGYQQVGWERARQSWLKKLAIEGRANEHDWEYKRAIEWEGWRFIGEECGTDCLRIPTGCVQMFILAAGALGKRAEVFNDRVKPMQLTDVDWSLKPTREPRPYQDEAVAAMIQAGGRGIIQSPTASGKSYMMAMLISHYKVTTLIKVPRLIILDQIVAELKDNLNIDEGDIGFIGKSKYEPSLITVVTTQSLASIKKDKDRWGDLMNLHRVYGWGMLIEDECFPAGTLISTPLGAIPIEDIRIADIVYSFNETTGEIEEKRVTHKFKTKTFVRDVDTKSGTITSTPDHPFYTFESSKRQHVETISEARSKQRPSRLIVPTIPISEIETVDRWYLWGLVAGDFTINKNNNVIRTSVKKPDKVFLLRSLQRKHIDLKESKNSRGDYNFWFVDTDGYMTKWLNEHGIPSGKKSNRFEYIPESNDYKEWVSLLRGIFDADGYVTGNRVGLDLVSEKFIIQAKKMLRILGIRITGLTRKRSKTNPNHGDVYRIQIAGKENLERFRDIIGFRRVRASSVLDELISSLSHDRTYHRHGYNEAIIEEHTDYEIKEVFNLEVEDNHNYITDGYLVHNCHHGASKTSYETSMAINAPNRIGFSGTALDREDNENIRTIAAYGEIVFNVPSQPLVDDGFLIKPTVKFIPCRPVPVDSNAMWPTVYNTAIVYNNNRNLDILEIAGNMVKEGRSTLIFVDRIDHGEILENMSPALFILKDKVRFVHGTHPERDQIISDFKTGKLSVLISTEGIIGEGFDFRGLNAMIIADGGKSYIQTIQKRGRGMRVEEGKIDLKMFDFADRGKYVGEHSLRRKTSYEANGFKVDITDTPYLG